LGDRFKSLPNGWLSEAEADILYTAPFVVPPGGAILEIGSWIGRSSCCLAHGIRDASHQIRYDIVDFGIAGIDEWHDRLGGNILEHDDAKAFLNVICAPGGTAAALKQNLVDRGLAKYVTLIILGDFTAYEPQQRYDLIFCDAAHDEAELRRNIPMVARVLQEECILICDDIVTRERAAMVNEFIHADHYYLTCEVEPYTKLAIFTRGERYRDFLF